MNHRLKELRKTLKSSQEEFGNRLGITGGGISKLKCGLTNFAEQMITSICIEFNVSSIWPEEGKGDMLLNLFCLSYSGSSQSAKSVRLT